MFYDYLISTIIWLVVVTSGAAVFVAGVAMAIVGFRKGPKRQILVGTWMSGVGYLFSSPIVFALLEQFYRMRRAPWFD